MLRASISRGILFLAAFICCTAPLLAADLKVTTENGVTTVVFNGKQVFMGNTSGTVRSRTGSYDGVELAAAYDDETVIWENVSGAGRFLQEAEKQRQHTDSPSADTLAAYLPADGSCLPPRHARASEKRGIG